MLFPASGQKQLSLKTEHCVGKKHSYKWFTDYDHQSFAKPHLYHESNGSNELLFTFFFCMDLSLLYKEFLKAVVSEVEVELMPFSNFDATGRVIYKMLVPIYLEMQLKTYIRI